MIVNNTNIEGISTIEELNKIKLEDCEVVNKSIEINMPYETRIKEVVEISIKVSAEEYKSIKFDDQKLVLQKIKTDIDILFVEDNEQSLVSFMDKHMEFIYNFKNNSKNKYTVTVKVIDCLFNNLDSECIAATLIYLIKKNENEAFLNEESKVSNSQYKLIDIEEEFY